MKHLGIVVAMPAETRSLTHQPIPFGRQIRLQEGVSLYAGGVGSTHARLAAEALLGRGANALLSWGSAGGLVPNLPPGSIILPKSVIAADQTTYPVNLKWHEYLWNQLAGHLDLHSEPLAESPVVLACPAEKKALFSQTGAIAVDMESAAVAAVAHEARVPFLAIRAIADSANKAIPRSILSAVDDFGRLSFLKLFKASAKRPTELFALVCLGLNFRSAHTSLATVARLTGSNFFVP